MFENYFLIKIGLILIRILNSFCSSFLLAIAITCKSELLRWTSIIFLSVIIGFWIAIEISTSKYFKQEKELRELEELVRLNGEKDQEIKILKEKIIKQSTININDLSKDLNKLEGWLSEWQETIKAPHFETADIEYKKRVFLLMVEINKAIEETKKLMAKEQTRIKTVLTNNPNYGNVKEKNNNI